MSKLKKNIEILFLGDTHGSLSNFFFLCKQYNLKNQIVFHVGDFGAGFLKDTNKWLNEINDMLSEYNIIMYVIRGNHDDPLFYQGNHILSHLKLMPDYSTIKINDRRFLLVGGAISIDRYIRNTEHKRMGYTTWWEDEVFVLNKRKLSKYRNITDVITHTGPSTTPPFGPLPNFIHEQTQYDLFLIRDLDNEREKLREMYEILNKNNEINNWYYGHFHRSELYEMNDTKFRILDINELI